MFCLGWSSIRTQNDDWIRQTKHKVAIAEKRVGVALSMVSPRYTAQRRTSITRAVNLILYRADYFGHKLHIDQNERLVMYGSLMSLQLMDTVDL